MQRHRGIYKRYKRHCGVLQEVKQSSHHSTAQSSRASRSAKNPSCDDEHARQISKGPMQYAFACRNKIELRFACDLFMEQ